MRPLPPRPRAFERNSRPGVLQQAVHLRASGLRPADAVVGVDPGASGAFTRRGQEVRMLLQRADPHLPPDLPSVTLSQEFDDLVQSRR